MRTLFPSRTLGLHTRQNEANLPHLCQVQLNAEAVDDGEGGSTPGWLDSGSALPCRVSPVGSAEERLQADQIQADMRFVVVFEAATVIALNARLVITIGAETLKLDPDGSNGPRSYEAQRKYECSLWEGSE